MPTYNIHYFVVKPLTVPVHKGSTGSRTKVTPTSPSATALGNKVLAEYEKLLAKLFQNCIKYVPGSNPGWTFKVKRIPAKSPGVPNFAGLSVKAREPLVYLVTKNVQENPSSPTDRRAPLVLAQAISGPKFSRKYQEFDLAFINSIRNAVQQGASAEGGLAIHCDDYLPATAEVNSNAKTSFEATNWLDIYAGLLANISFHEIAHSKAECKNRKSGSKWRAAISGIIHNVAGASICGASVGWSTPQSTADKRLMGEHMMCPISFYHLDQPIKPQIRTKGKVVALHEIKPPAKPSATKKVIIPTTPDPLDGL